MIYLLSLTDLFVSVFTDRSTINTPFTR